MYCLLVALMVVANAASFACHSQSSTDEHETAHVRVRRYLVLPIEALKDVQESDGSDGIVREIRRQPVRLGKRMSINHELGGNDELVRAIRRQPVRLGKRMPSYQEGNDEVVREIRRQPVRLGKRMPMYQKGNDEILREIRRQPVRLGKRVSSYMRYRGKRGRTPIRLGK